MPRIEIYIQTEAQKTVLLEFIKERGYYSVSEYFRALIRKDMKEHKFSE